MKRVPVFCSKNCGGKGWQKWKLYEIKGIPVSGGVCEIRLSMDGDSGNWGNADDLEFAPDAE